MRSREAMSKLFFRYGAMNSGKSTALLQVAHNYEEREQAVLLAKPRVDTKGQDQVVSRLGVNRSVDLMIHSQENLRHRFNTLRAERDQTGPAVACLLIDEAQFLSSAQVDQALAIAVFDNIPVLAYGIRTDFRTQSFPGSQRLLEVAHSLEEMKTICRCGSKAIFTARMGPDGIDRDGEQIKIDAGDVRYEALCGRCYLSS